MSEERRELVQWQLQSVDPLTGELLSDEELAYRARILQEAQEGFTGVDALYFSTHRIIHQPLTDEQGLVSGDGWKLDRANNTTLRVAQSEGLDPSALEKLAVTIVRGAIDDFAAEVMLMLFTLANDPPNWRRPQLHIQLSDLLDRLNFKRDSRGLHYSDARRKLSTTLLALQLTQIGVQQRAERKGEASVGFIAPLLSGITYATQQEIGNLSPVQVFEQGLPDSVTVYINPLWYQGLREPDGSPGRRYTLIPRQEPRPAPGRARGGSRSPALRLVREYLQRCKQAERGRQVAVTKQVLLNVAGIANRRADKANASLGRVLHALLDEKVIQSYEPDPLPLDALAIVTLRWTPD